MLGNKKIVSILAILCTGILPLAAAFWSLNMLQTSETTLFIDPPSIVYETLIPGKRFDVYIMVTNVTELKGYKVKLSFDRDVIGLVGVELLPQENLPVGDFSADNSSGVLTINVTYDGDSITTTDPVAVAKITFKTMGYGESSLHLYDTLLLSPTGEPIPHETVDGSILIRYHDVEIVNVTSSTTETYAGRTVTVTVTAKNNGNSAEDFTVTVYHDDVLFGTFDVIGLTPGASIPIIFIWYTSDVAAGYSYTLKAEASTVPSEGNTANNVYVDGAVKVKIIGDVNNNDVVDINDLNAWDLAYESHEGDLNWNPQADIDDNGVVDNNDGILIIQHYHNMP